MRHSRTILALGANNHSILQHTHFCIIGMNPIGVEIVKSLLLFGVNKISCVDNGFINQSDIDGTFFINKRTDINHPRSSVFPKSLHRLNPESTIEFVEKPCGDFIFLTENLPPQRVTDLNNFCRSTNAGFLYTATSGFSSSIFIDFGDFLVKNAEGKQPESYRISEITNENPARVFFTRKTAPSIRGIKRVVFTGLKSMPDLNEKEMVLDATKSKQGNFYLQGLDLSDREMFDSLESCGYMTLLPTENSLHHHVFNPSECPFFSKERDFQPTTTTFIASVCVTEAIKYATHWGQPIENQYQEFIDKYIPNRPDLKDKKVAVIGVGAVGCEVAKILALSGVKKLDLVDADHIETTNLNRQFLYSDEDVGLNKAEAAKKTLLEYDPTLEINVYPFFVDESTTKTFSLEWFKSQDGVFALVDTFKARNYISKRCAIADIPMFTGGISKNSADWTASIPNCTNLYNTPPIGGSSRTPTCTLKLFPHSKEHCIEWAHGRLTMLATKTAKTWDECIKMSCYFFVKHFNHNPRDLQFFHPKNEKVGYQYFWSNHRIYPDAISFDESNPHHMMCVKSIAIFIANQNGIQPGELVPNFDEMEWTEPDPGKRNRIADNEHQNNQRNVQLGKFDKENQNHLDVITSAANCRSQVYRLGEIDKLFAESFAGQISPTLSTTSAVCSARVVENFYQSFIEPHNVTDGKYITNSSFYSSYLLPPPRKFKLGIFEDKTVSEWEFWTFKGSDTIFSIQEEVARRTGAKIFSWSSENNLMPLTNALYGPKATKEQTFRDFFKDVDHLIVEASLETDSIDLYCPTIVIDFNQ